MAFTAVLVIGGVELAIPAFALQEVIDWPDAIVPQLRAPPVVLGLFNLRGVATPAIDLRRLDPGGGAGGKQRIAILNTPGGRLGVAIDDIADVIRASQPAQALASAAVPDDHPLVRSLLIEENGKRIVQLLDIDAVLALPGIMLSRADPVQTAATGDVEALGQYLFFECDGLHFCVEAAGVREVVEHTALHQTSNLSGFYRGQLRLRDAEMPVLDLFHVLGMRESLTKGGGAAKSKLLVLDGGGQIAAMTISEVTAIQRLSRSDVMTLPPMGLDRPALFGGVVKQSVTGTSALLLDHRAMFAEPTVAGLRDLQSSTAAGGEKRTGGVAGVRTAYLGFEAGQTFSAPLTQIEEIMPLPASCIEAAPPDGPILGFIERRGEAVPLIMLRRLIQRPDLPADSESRVLIVKQGCAPVGFVVDRTTAVEHVFIRAPLDPAQLMGEANGGPVAAASRLAMAEEAKGEYVKAFVDLVELARQLESSPRV